MIKNVSNVSKQLEIVIFKRMTYTEAIDYLLKADVKFENKVEWGMDLNSEHERYICEKIDWWTSIFNRLP